MSKQVAVFHLAQILSSETTFNLAVKVNDGVRADYHAKLYATRYQTGKCYVYVLLFAMC